MEPPTSTNQDEELFFDATEDFPFFDCLDSLTDQYDQLTSSVALSNTDHKPHPETLPLSTTLRRRSYARDGASGEDSNYDADSFCNSTRSSTGKRFNLHQNLNENKEISESGLAGVSSVQIPSEITEQKNEDSTLTTANDEQDRDEVESAVVHVDSFFNFLTNVAEFVIKAIRFPFGLMYKSITFPIWVLYNVYMFFVDPFGVWRRVRDSLIQKLMKLCSSLVYDWLKHHISIWKIALSCGWGLLWLFYVSFVLLGLLVSSLVASGFIMRCLVEEPVQMKEMLSFDFTKHSPVAYFPISSCVGVNSKEHVKLGSSKGLRIVPPNHKLQATVSLILPESEYNRNLGVFQVRVDFLSDNGKTIASLSKPYMIRFKSEPIRLLSTFLKMFPLICGYISESQILNVKIGSIIEGDVPTACLKVTIEQRAEYPPDARIPEMYDASLLVESELPLFKRILWYWKRIIFIWTSMVLFMMELLFVLICCRPIIIPRSRPWGGTI